MRERIAALAAKTGLDRSRLYDMLKTIRQFDRYAEEVTERADSSAAYDDGFADGIREVIKMHGSNNHEIAEAIKELPGGR